MKIAVCIPVELHNHGGVEQHILCLAHAMRQLGQHVDVYCRNAPAAAAILQHEFETVQWLKDLKNLDHKRYDIIHTHSGFYCWEFFRGQMNRRPRQRYVHTSHNVALDYLLACRAWLNWRCYYDTIVQAMWYRYSDHIIAVSSQVKHLATNLLGANPDKVSVIYNGYNDEVPPVTVADRQLTRDKLQLKEDDIALLFVGRGEDKVKGTKIVQTCMEQLSISCRKSVRLLAVPGTGFQTAQWLLPAGPVSHSDMRNYYAAADIFINASLSEGLPLTIIEAMAAGLAIVAAPVGGIPQVIKDNHSGLLLEPDRSNLAQKVELLINNPPLRRILGTNARQAAEMLTWEKIAKKTIAVYDSIV
jgi:glycosyltransferase involved in cell wall biosynthesis